MKRALKYAPLLFLVLLTFSACSGQITKQSPQEKAANNGADITLNTFTSSFGYTMNYDPHLFYVLTDESSDNFELIARQRDQSPSVYVMVQRVGGYSVSEYTALSASNALNGVYSVTETTFGADGRDAVTVTYANETDLGLVYYAETSVKVGSDLLCIKVVTYDGMPADINTAIEKMLSTFTVQE